MGSSYELLGLEQARALLEPSYARGAIGHMFWALVRGGLSTARGADSLAYEELNRNGKLEVVISVAGIAAWLKDGTIGDIPNIGPESTKICQELVDMFNAIPPDQQDLA